jgi:hypothetical protein
MKHVILIVMSIWLVASSAILSHAEQKGINLKPAELTPLKQTLTVNMSAAPVNLCTTLPQKVASIKQLAHHDLQTMLSQQGDQPIKWPGIGDLYYSPTPVYTHSVETCCSPTKSFSVQDQQAAGCAGSDTVNQCVDKLIKHCISNVPRKAEIKALLQKSQTKASQYSAKMQQLAAEIQQLLSQMP